MSHVQSHPTETSGHPWGASGMRPSWGCYFIPILQIRKLRHRKAGKGQRQDLNRPPGSEVCALNHSVPEGMIREGFLEEVRPLLQQV